ncbi:isoleucine--tRNA ligase [Mycobacterium sp. TNTM28]|uniref:Isoleucine--tRNA ligase n=1 Tax=[Mycobacterium] fortunisiensis TaxID=2600579 RepID=A0ABS6KN17_9MYCO|nr:isoleucine--tRNA ligase [[Mycobacterium] fortunisiensis]MBU9764981.1 isoleucine--tRNA ligase [[Mycobacterium] fortunisiensis]
MTAYPKPAAPNFPERELEVLAYWAADDTFPASIARREDAPEYVFYDGPPFANGLPHYGHLLTGYVKDIVPRYRTMRGYKVERRFGWDTHGLPAELEVQRQLGIADKAQIEEMGIEKFNAACRASVLKYTDEWRDYVTRQARWVDFDNDYKTLDPTFMESVIWAFKQLWDKGLAYEGNRVLPYCWNDETPLSNHELRMDDDVYQSRQDPAVTVGFTVTDGPLKGAHLLIWTTTPWTLPSNQAVAVNPDIDYVLVQGADGRRYVLAQARLAAYARELGEEPEVLGSYLGRDLLGTRYLPPFTYFVDSDGARNAFQVLAADFVSTEDGTGIVHMAPAYGEDDKATADTADIVAVTPVDSKGRFDSSVPDYQGQHVFEANAQIIRDLKNRAAGAAANGAVLLRHETYEHSYPHCWRCRNPLIYRAVSSWFIKVTDFRDRMVELNQQITWYPEHVKDGQFGKWLSNARDWSVSRNRYWGSPIPVWKSDDPAYPRIDVYGSLDELERDFGVRPTDLHRPFIDELTRPNPDDPTGKSTMRRIEDVFDVWFDSGSMPYAQVHYPFENQEWFDGKQTGADAHFPGDFIVEYIGQTRGWFYTMHVLATALFDKPAFKTCVAHGIVLGNDGAKMSKSLRNYPDVSEVFDRDGSDAMRWFLMASPILRGGNLIVTEQGIREGVRQVLLPLWNAYSFLALYAPEKGTWRTDSDNVLDRYILAKLARLRDDLTVSLDTCDISGACDELRQFTEALTNWYVRRSRSRFWEEDADAIDTLHTVLEVTCRLAAPLLPLATEVIWRGLTGERSVHLTDWPEADVLPKDADLVAAMDQVREVCSVGSSLRKAKKLRVRLPLPKLTVALDKSVDPSSLAPFADLIADELNVKAVELTDDIDTYGKFELAVNARVAGPRIGKDVQAAIKAVKAGQGVVNPDGTLTAGPVVLQPEEYTSKLVAAEPQETERSGARPTVQWTAALPDGAGLVVLDGTVTEELEAEGWAKDRIRELQELRKSTGLEVSDRISVQMSVPAQYAPWASTHRDLIAGEILATSFEFGDVVDGAEIGDGVRVAIAKA